VYDQNSISVNSHGPAGPSRRARFTPVDDVGSAGLSGVQELLNCLHEYSPTLAVEVNAINMELPTIISRDLIEALSQNHFSKHIVAVERSDCEMGKCLGCPRAGELPLERLVEGNVVSTLVRRDVGDDVVVGGDQVVEPRLDRVARIGIFSKRRKRTQPDPPATALLEAASIPGRIA
jgi:hypothetical protein